jgi:hypothetical protein
MNKPFLLWLVVGLLVLIAFGAGCATRMMRVNAAGFSDASLSGGYSLLDIGETLGTGSIKFAEADVVTFDGAGNLRGNGTMNDGGRICVSTIMGTYRVNADGTGSATLSQTPDAVSAAGGCITVSIPLALALSNGGAQIQFTEPSDSEVASGSALKQ